MSRNKPSLPTPPPLTPDEFKVLVKSKGWSYRDLAVRWSITPSYVTRLAQNEQRPVHWDDAVRGLPVVMRSK